MLFSFQLHKFLTDLQVTGRNSQISRELIKMKGKEREREGEKGGKERENPCLKFTSDLDK